MKKIIPFLVIIGITFLQLNVIAVSHNTPVSSNITYSECVKFQSGQVSTSGDGYFGHCIKANCYSGVWQSQYLISANLVSCNNGNTNRFTQIIADGCAQYTGRCAQTTQVRYCTLITYYDCGRTMNGSPFTTTTRPPIAPPTTRPPTTRPGVRPPMTTPAPPPVEKSDNDWLKSLEVVDHELNFEKTKLNYTIEISEDTKSLEIIAIPEDEKATILIEFHEEIDIEQAIKITVTAENGDARVYTINLKHETIVLDSNTRLLFIAIAGYKIKFDPDVYSYTVTIKDENNLDIDVETESPTSEYEIIGNKDLKNKSQIRILVTAEDGSQATYLLDVRTSISGNVIAITIVLIIVGIIGFFGFKIFKKMYLDVKEGNPQYEYE